MSRFVEGGGEHNVTSDQITSNVVNFDIKTDGVSNLDTVNLDVVTDEADDDGAVSLCANIDDTVGVA